MAYLEIMGQARCWPSLSGLFETVALPTPYDRGSLDCELPRILLLLIPILT